jgi:hypothetical protein
VIGDFCVRSAILAVMALSLAACSDVPQPFGKQNPQVSPGGWITRPPSETFKTAGPMAEYEIDYETLEGPIEKEEPIETAELNPAQPKKAVAAVEPPLAAEEPPPEKPKPKKEGAVEIKAVAVVPVKGARGKGNDELTKAMRETLAKAGWPVLKAPRKDALTIAGTVAMAGATEGKEQVTVAWKVTGPDGKMIGSIDQANTVDAGSLDKGFGENAVYAAEAAATGIFNLVKKLR